jgi:hypothetical protein
VVATRSSRGHLAATAAAIGASALATGWIAFSIGGATATLWLDDTATAAAAALAFALCLRASAHHRGRLRLHWSLMAAAAACWFGAEVTWAVYALVLVRPVPAPSWADAGYLLAIPLAAAAVAIHPAAPRHTVHAIRSLIEGLVIAGSLLFLSWTLVLASLWQQSDLGSLAGAVSVAYPCGDLVIAFFAVIAIRGMRGGRASLWYLLAGLLAMAFSDTVYAYLVSAGRYSSSGAHVLDVGWIVAYLGIALAAWSSAGEPARFELRPHRSRPPLTSLVLPLVPVLVALLVTAIEVRTGHRLDRTTWLIAVSLAALVLLRESLLLHELLGPRGRSKDPMRG